jgi:hypothetical protein
MAARYPKGSKQLRAFYSKQALLRSNVDPSLRVALAGYKTTGAVTRTIRHNRKANKHHKQLKGLPGCSSRTTDLFSDE